MFQARLLQTNISIWLFVLRLCGFWPYYYDTCQRRYRTRWFLLPYPIVMWLLLLLFFDSTSEIVYSWTRIEFHTDTARIIYTLYAGMCVLTFSSSYWLQYLWLGRIEGELNVASDLLKDVLKNSTSGTGIIPSTPYIRQLLLFMLKAALLPFVAWLLNVTNALRLSLTADQCLRQTAMLELSITIMGLVPNVHIAMLLTATVLYCRLNVETSTIVLLAAQQAQPLRRPPSDDHSSDHFRRMQHFCLLSDRLDRVAELHARLTEITTRLNRMFATSLVIWITFKCMEALTHAFLAYVFVCQWLMAQTVAGSSISREAASSGDRYPVEIVVIDVLVALVAWLDVFLLAKICLATDKQVHTRRNCTI